MTLAQLTNVHLAFGAREVLSGVSLGITQKSRLALTGANGSGKTTLLRLLVGELKPDSGQISIPRGVRVSYLAQDATVPAEGTLYEAAEEAFDEIEKLIAERDRIGDELRREQSTDDEQQKLIEQFHEIEQQIDSSGYYRREAQIDWVLTGLGFERDDFDRPLADFSGGWRMRIALSRILLESPELLLLDEPTNYLDLEARDWLVGYLNDYHGGLVLVSHDRDLLDQVTTHVAELFMSKVRVYTGNFSSYERTRHAELEELEKKYKEQQAEIARLEEFISRFRYNASKASLVQSRIRQLEKIEPIELPESMKPIHFSFPEAPASGRRVIEARDLTKSYRSEPLFDGLNLEIERGEKVVVVGRNGAGKSTLLRILAGQDDEFGGSARYGSGVVLRTFSADTAYVEADSKRVFEAIEEQAPTEMYPRLRDLLGAFLFRGDDIYKPVSVLSGGERSRLALASMLLSPANLLILDEPTNHLDISSKDVLLSSLQEFSGAVVFVSHDRHFIRNLATRVVELSRAEGEPSRMRTLPGDYEYYRWRLEREAESAEQDAAPTRSTRESSGTTSAKETAVRRESKQEHAERKKRRNRAKQIEREEEEILAELDALEARTKEIQDRMSMPDVYSDGTKIKELHDELSRNEEKQAELTTRWERLEEEREELEERTSQGAGTGEGETHRNGEQGNVRR